MNTTAPVRYLLLLVILLAFSHHGNAQFWTENFGTGCNKGNGAANYVTTNGTWTVSNVGVNGNTPHLWFISATSAISTMGNPCDNNCSGANPGNNNRTLHISNPAVTAGPPLNLSLNADTGGVFFPGGLAAAGIDVSTSKRVESPTINCTGETAIFISFDYFEGGTAPNQNGTVEYFDGSTWFTLSDPGKSTCSANQGSWTASGLLALPASADNNPNVKIGFRWENNNVAAVSAPEASYSIDNINLYSNSSPPPGPPLVNFNPLTQTTICDGGAVTFQDLSLNADSVRWTFPGGTPNTSTATTPNITYNTPGIYNVQLRAFNSSGTSDTTAVGLVVVNACSGPPNAEFSASNTTICRGDSIDFTDLSTDFPSSWAWFFPGATNRDFDTVQNPQNIVYDTVGTFEVTLVVENAAGQDFLTKTNYITVVECPAPIAAFSVQANKDTVCVGDVVQFVDETQYADTIGWIFNDADSVNFTSNLGPRVIYDSAGVYSVSLVVGNPYGQDIEVKTDYITVLPYPFVDAGVDQFIYAGEKTILGAEGTTEFFYWEPREYLSCYLCSSPQAFPEDTTTFYVVNYYDNEAICPTEDSLTIIVEQEYFAGVPDIFSPNRDNVNDKLFVIGNGIFRSDLMVYNRHGQKVYEYTPENPFWDGTFKGRDMEPGVYTYVANVQFINGDTELLKGTVTLVR